MPEMPHAGQHHGHAALVGGGNHFVIADAAAGLDFLLVKSTLKGTIIHVFKQKNTCIFLLLRKWR